MTPTPNRSIENANDQLPMDLNDLISAVEKLPQEYSQLRMDMKYLMFDLEATRRERDSYKDAFEGDI